MISINNVNVFFPGGYLFNDVSFIIGDKDKIGLVGKNGAGKSTLLKILTKEITPEEGNIVYSQDTTLGYLPQDLQVVSDKTVLDEAMMAFEEIIAIQNKINFLQQQIAASVNFESKEYHDLLHKLAFYNERFHLLDGMQMQANVEKILLGLGFIHADFSRKMSEFSGGWQMRVEIAKILLRQPKVMLLDEPTNHLDIESIQWFENYLCNYSGAVVLVSHDRAFLDRVTERTVEISNQKIYDYKASYSEYVLMRQERVEQQMAAFNNQQKEIEDIEKFIERFRYKASKARQVQSRVKMLEKIDKIDIDEINNPAIHFKFPPAPHSGRIVIEAVNVSKSYGEKNVIQNINFVVEKGEHVAFVGKNGEGKTTLSKIIAGEIEYQGNLKMGHNVLLGYYAQNQADLLDLDKTVFETLDEIAVGEVRTRIRAILGSFLFSGESIEKKVKVLSGGEKSRLALARLLLSPCNLLVLDEPTNHLDMQSKDVLKNALLQYNGTLIVVSHDRDFLQGLTQKVFEFKNKKVSQFIGDIYEFIEYKNIKNLDDLQNNLDAVSKKEKIIEVGCGKLNYEQKKLQDKEIRKLQNQIKQCEEAIEKNESEMQQLTLLMSQPEKLTNEKYTEICILYNDLKKQNDDSLEQWETLHQQLLNLQNK